MTYLDKNTNHVCGTYTTGSYGRRLLPLVA